MFIQLAQSQTGWPTLIQVCWGKHCAINSARLALFIHRITSAKRMREVQPALLVRENSTQVLMYSLDMYVSYTVYNYDSVDFQVSEVFCKGSEF